MLDAWIVVDDKGKIVYESIDLENCIEVQEGRKDLYITTREEFDKE